MDYQEYDNSFFMEMTEEKRIQVHQEFIKLINHIIATRYSGMPYEEIQELISEGYVGLQKALNTFNPTKETKFSTYAFICIDNEMKLYLRKLQRCYKATGYNTTSLEATILDTDIPFIDTLESDEEFENDLIERMVCDSIFEDIENGLKESEKELLEMFFIKNMAQKDIADIYGISQSGVSKKVKRLKKKIRKKGKDFHG